MFGKQLFPCSLFTWRRRLWFWKSYVVFCSENWKRLKRGKEVSDGNRYEALSKLYMTELEHFCCFVYYTCFHLHSLSPAFITSPALIVCIYNPEIVRLFLTLILLTWRIGWAPNNARKWQIGFNWGFKVLILCVFRAVDNKRMFINHGILN